MNTVSKLIVTCALVTLGSAGLQAQTQQPAQQAPSTVDPAAQQKGAQPQAPGTTGGMDKATTGVATSPDDVKRQTEGRPTAADEAKGATSTTPKPATTQQSPGTVGAAPGTTPPMGEKKQ